MPFGLGFFAVAGAGGAAGSFDLLATTVLGSDAASVTFTSLGDYSQYKHLQVRYTSRITENVGGAGTFYTNLNGDTGANYARHFLRGNGSNVVSGALASTSTPDIGYTAGAESASNIFSAGVIDLLDAYESTKYKTMRTSSGLVSGYKEVWTSSLVWLNTASVTSWSFETFGSFQFVTGSRFSLYGIKGA